MKLYLKQKFFSLKGEGIIWDEDGIDRYYYENIVFTLGRKTTIFNTNREEIIYIEQELFHLLPQFNIYVKGEMIAKIISEFNLFKPKYRIELMGLHVEGSWNSLEYSIYKGSNIVATISKKWMVMTDTFEIDVLNPVFEHIVVGLVMIIDAVMDAKKRRR